MAISQPLDFRFPDFEAIPYDGRKMLQMLGAAVVIKPFLSNFWEC
jgi:hypothetical protein